MDLFWIGFWGSAIVIGAGGGYALAQTMIHGPGWTTRIARRIAYRRIYKRQRRVVRRLFPGITAYSWEQWDEAWAQARCDLGYDETYPNPLLWMGGPADR